MPTKTYDPEKLTPEQNAVIESILKMAEAEVSSEPERKYCIWKPIEGDAYFYYDSICSINSSVWSDCWIDQARYNCGDCYRTEEEAFFAAERSKVITELRRFAEEHNDPIDWENIKQEKVILFLNHDPSDPEECGRVQTKCWYASQFPGVCFSSVNVAKNAILTIGEDRLIKYYFGSYKEQE